MPNSALDPSPQNYAGWLSFGVNPVIELISASIKTKRRYGVRILSANRRVAQIEFTEWTPYGQLRHSKFVGLGEDKMAREVVQQGFDKLLRDQIIWGVSAASITRGD